MSRPARWAARPAAVGLAIVVVLAVVLVIEVVVARRGPMLEGGPLALDGQVGGGTDGGAGAPLRVVWLGDSTAAGVGVAGPGDALATVVADRLVAGGLGRPVELTVLAQSGDRVGDVIDDQLASVAALAPDVVFVSVGANDVTHLTRRGNFRDRYRRLLAELPPEAEVVALGVPDMGAVPRLAQPLRSIAGFRGRQLDDVVVEVAGEAGATYVPIAAATGPLFRAEPGELFAADRYHPSAAGYQTWADAVLAEVGSLVR